MCMIHEKMSVILANMALSGAKAVELEPLMRFARVDRVKRVILSSSRTRGEYLFLILEGRFKVALDGCSKQYRVSGIYLNTLAQYDCFGEYSLLDAQPTSASVIAITMPDY